MARGGLVDHAAVNAALDSGRLKAAGLDVYSTEPFPVRDPFLGRREIVATPHVAGVTERSYGEMSEVLVENLRRMFVGEDLLHVVNSGDMQKLLEDTDSK